MEESLACFILLPTQSYCCVISFRKWLLVITPDFLKLSNTRNSPSSKIPVAPLLSGLTAVSSPFAGERTVYQFAVCLYGDPEPKALLENNVVNIEYHDLVGKGNIEQLEGEL